MVDRTFKLEKQLLNSVGTFVMKKGKRYTNVTKLLLSTKTTGVYSVVSKLGTNRYTGTYLGHDKRIIY